MKKIISLLLIAIMFISFSSKNLVNAAPAPNLTKVMISDVTFDETGQLYVVIDEIGTSQSRNVFINNIVQGRYHSGHHLWGANDIAYGFRYYYKIHGARILNPDSTTGPFISNHPGKTYKIKVESWGRMGENKTASATIVLP